MLTAGIFHQKKVCKSWGDVTEFTKKKFLKIYVPFVIVTMFLTLLQPFLSAIHWDVNAPYQLREMIWQLFLIPFMRVEYLNGPCWFLIAYLEVSFSFEFIRLLLVFLCEKILKRPSTDLLNNLTLLILASIFFALGQRHELPRWLDEAAVLFLWYTLGFLFYQFFQNAKKQKIFSFRVRQCFFMIAALIIFSALISVVARTGTAYAWKKGDNLFLIVILSFGGISGCWFLSQVLKDMPLAAILGYIGKQSFTIMTWHFAGFKILSSILILFSIFSMDELFGYVPRMPNIYWKILYVLFGIFIPCGFQYVWQRFLLFIKNKLRDQFSAKNNEVETSL